MLIEEGTSLAAQTTGAFETSVAVTAKFMGETIRLVTIEYPSDPTYGCELLKNTTNTISINSDDEYEVFVKELKLQSIEPGFSEIVVSA